MADSKLADFIGSKKGGVAVYGTLFGAPVAVAFALVAGIPSYDFDKTTTPESQTAVAEYTAESRDLMNTYNTLAALREAAAVQSSPDAVVEFMQRKAEVKTELDTRAHDFQTRILTDSRLTEGDYAEMRKNLEFQNTDYLNLPNGSRVLEESRAAATGATPEAKASEISDAMLSYVNNVDGKGSTALILLLAGLMVTGFLGASGIVEDVRYGVQSTLRRREKRPKKGKMRH